MAGEWIKMRNDLSDDPGVITLANILGVSEDEIVGKLHRLWSWADRHTTDGRAPGITVQWVDRYICSGFAQAMVQVGWLSFDSDGIIFPRFDRHNGDSAKRRIEATIRQRLSRESRDKGVTGDKRTGIPAPFRRHVFERDNFTCVYCGDKSNPSKEDSRQAKLVCDHVIPSARGGTSTVDNLVSCCKLCNSEKSDRTPEEWDLLPSFFQDGVTYVSQKICDNRVTKPLPEKRREEKKINPPPPEGDGSSVGTVAVVPLSHLPGNLQTPEFVAAWERWQAFKRERRQKFTPSTAGMQLANLSKQGPTVAAAMIDQSIEKGWTGLFELKADLRAKPPPATPDSIGYAGERAATATADKLAEELFQRRQKEKNP